MKINFTSKLYFRQYAYKVVLSCRASGGRWWRRDGQTPVEFTQLTTWCETHAPNAHEIRRRVQKQTNRYTDWHQVVYVQTEHVKNSLVQEYGANVLEVTQPLDTAHGQLLEVRNITEVRHNLIYKKYNHVIYFKYDRPQQLWEWLENIVNDSEHSVLKGNRLWPKVYSCSLDDVQMIQLSYADRIDYVKHVILLPG
jgi:hypothetical protein